MTKKNVKSASSVSAQQYLDINQALMVALDAEGRIVMMNRAGRELLGYAEDEILGRNWFETCLPQPEGTAIVLPIFLRIMAGELAAVECFENEVVCRNGMRRLIRWHNAEMRDETGRIVGALSSGEDITERKKTEEELRLNESRFRNAFEHSAIGMALVSPEGKWLKVNRRVCDIVGYTEDELMRKTFQDITHPEDLDTDLDFVRRMLIGEIETYQMEKRYFHKDGHIVWVLLAVSLVWDEHGSPLHFISQIKDITERKAAEAALRDERQVFMGGPTVVFKWRAAEGWPVEYVSPNVESVLGYASDDLLSGQVNYLHLIHPDDLTRVLQEVLDHSASGHAQFDQEYRLAHADGGYRWIHDYTRPVRNPNGELVCYHGYLVDITERKQAEELSRQRHDEFLAIFNGMDMPVYVSDPETYELVYANRVLQDTFGPFADRKCYEYLQHRDQPCPFCTNDRIFGEHSGQSHIWEFRNEANRRWYRCIDRAIAWPDGRNLRLELAIDITERKRAEEALRESEERYALALCGAHDGIWDWDLRSNAVRYSPQWKAMLGYADDEIRNELSEWQRLVHPEDGKRAFAAVEEYLAGRTGDLTVEMRMRHKKGHWVPVLSRGGVVRDAAGRPVRIVGTHVDITARKKMEEALLQSKKSESLGRMAGAVAHHYNNLMCAVLGNLDLAADPAADPEEAALLISEARSAANRAASISRLMLAYLGHLAGTKKPLNLAAVCRESLATITSRLPAKVRLEGAFPFPGPVVRADAAQMREVLDALVTNASEALGEMGGEIAVTVAEMPVSNLPVGHMLPSDWQPTGERLVCLSVADKGAGMAPETVEKIFDPFFSTKFTGRGLGIPVVLGITKAHNGAVLVESRPGAGTVVRVFLPLTDEKMPELPSAGMPAAPMAGQGLVLVVDDEPILRSLAQRVLKSLGYETITASNGAEAIEIFRQYPQEICCVLCDLTMPGMNGWETMAALRRIRPGVPVVLCSGYDEASVMAGVRDDLPQAFLGKPYEREALSGALAKALGR